MMMMMMMMNQGGIPVVSVILFENHISERAQRLMGAMNKSLNSTTFAMISKGNNNFF